MTTQASTWLATAPTILVVLLVLLTPGAVAARLAGVRGLAMIALAPGVTTSTVVAGGALAAILGVRWGPAAFLASVAVTWLLAAATGWARRRSPGGTGDRSLTIGLAGVAIACLGVLVVAIPVTGSPESFPQHPDTIFHLGTAQWMLDHGDISTFHAMGFSRVSGTGFYPAAWHGLVVTIAQLTHAPITVTSSVLALVTSGVVWPLAMVMLAVTVFGPGLRVSVAAAVTSVAFSAFPHWLMGYGVLWPNLLGQAILPSALACLVILTRPAPPPSPDPVPHPDVDHVGDTRWPGLPAATTPPLSRGQAGLALVTVVPGMAFAHPSAFISFVLLGYIMVAGILMRVAKSAGRERPVAAKRAKTGLVVGSAVALACWIAATGVSQVMRESNRGGPETGVGEAALDLLAFGPRGATRLWVLGALVIIGVVLVLARGSGRRWVATAMIVIGLMYFFLVSVDSPVTRLLTWPWYNNSPRLAALIVLPASLCATAVLISLSDGLDRTLRQFPGRLGSTRHWTSAVAPALVLVLITGGGYVNAHRKILDPYFHPVPRREWVNIQELAALRTLSTRIPADAVVAANPFNGGTYLYVVSGRRMLFPTEKSLADGDRSLLAEHLDDVGRSEAVCAAARRLGVRYAITGGNRNRSAKERYALYGGINEVGSSPAFRLVTLAPPYRLYELVRCAGD